MTEDKVYILGYKYPEDTELTEFSHPSAAQIWTSHWVEVEAPTYWDAVKKFPEAYKAWQEKSGQYNPPKGFKHHR